jgi:hypothetical protein
VLPNQQKLLDEIAPDSDRSTVYDYLTGKLLADMDAASFPDVGEASEGTQSPKVSVGSIGLSSRVDSLP